MVKKWKTISDKDKINIGTLIKGYTYSIGDYHTKHKKYLGNPKLRIGIIIETFSTNIFKVQFLNSAATKSEKQNKVNKIHYEFKNSKENGLIRGTDAYCILLQRKQIKYIRKEQGYIIENIEQLQTNIVSKHSREKKSAIKYIKSENFKNGLPKDKIDEIFEEWQFTNKEKYLSHEKAWEKISLLKEKHDSKHCIENEYQKIKNAYKFLDKEKINSNDYSNYQKFLESARKEYNNKQKLTNEYKTENEI